jgi:hypothetical protein
MDRDIYMDINLKELRRVEDLYKDKSTFYKSLRKGFGTSSPYTDCFVWCKKLMIRY